MNYIKLIVTASLINCMPSKIDTNLKDLQKIIDKIKQNEPVLYVNPKLLTIEERKQLRNRMWAVSRCLECKEINGSIALEEMDPNL
jgi:iron uptake system EfeUOB component EfeO/EfeM